MQIKTEVVVYLTVESEIDSLSETETREKLESLILKSVKISFPICVDDLNSITIKHTEIEFDHTVYNTEFS